MHTMTTVSKEHISKTPGVCGGKACIAGHRIRVMDIVVMYERWGFSPDQIADQYPGITLGDVHAALAYYFDHPAEIAAEFAREAATAEQYRDKFPSKLRGKLGG
jgi:uncharacterized protein (DUF433 family)